MRQVWILYPRGSMYGIFTYICHQIQPNVGEYTIHGYMDPMGMILPILLSSWWFQWSRIVLTPLYTWSKMIFFNWVESTHCFGWVCFSIGGVLNLYGIKIATFEGIRTLLGGHHKISCCFYFVWGRNSCMSTFWTNQPLRLQGELFVGWPF